MESEELIGKEAVSFFQQLFMIESDPSCSYGFLDAIPKLVTDLDNSKLMEPPAMDEVKETYSPWTGRAYGAGWVYRQVLHLFVGNSGRGCSQDHFELFRWGRVAP